MKLAIFRPAPPRSRRWVAGSGVALAIATGTIGQSAHAQPQYDPVNNILTMAFEDKYFSGSAGGVNDPPDPLGGPGGSWLNATFTDAKDVAGGGVYLTLKSSLPADAYFQSVAFNVDTSLDGFKVQACKNIGVGTTTCNGGYGSGASQWSYAVDKDARNMQNNIKGLDMEIMFAESNKNGGAYRFNGSDEIRFLLTGDGLMVKSFYTSNTTKTGISGIYGAAKLAGYGGSSTVTDPAPPPPEHAPGPLPILGAVAAFQAGRRLRRRLLPVPVAAG